MDQLSSRDDMVCMELSSSSCAGMGVPIDLSHVSQGISELPKGCQATCHVLWGTGNCSGVNAGELGLISS